MDKSALKDKRRETVIGLLKGMNIKKDSDGGFDKDDVYGCIQELCNLYEDHISELEDNYEAEITEPGRLFAGGDAAGDADIAAGRHDHDHRPPRGEDRL